MFQKTGDYITTELASPLEDYKLLENMNRVTLSKYSDMKQIANNLSASTSDLKLKFENLVNKI